MSKRKIKDPILQQKFDALEHKNEESLLGGGEKRIEQQHAKGKLTARERVLLLLDEGSFEELGKFVMHRSKDFGLDNVFVALKKDQNVGAPTTAGYFYQRITAQPLNKEVDKAI